MKIFTNKQYQNFLDEISLKISEANKEGFETGYEKGKKEGYAKGFHEGITFERSGIVFTSSGIYNFKDNEATEMTNNLKGEMTNENN